MEDGDRDGFTTSMPSSDRDRSKHDSHEDSHDDSNEDDNARKGRECHDLANSDSIDDGNGHGGDVTASDRGQSKHDSLDDSLDERNDRKRKNCHELPGDNSDGETDAQKRRKLHNLPDKDIDDDGIDDSSVIERENLQNLPDHDSNGDSSGDGNEDNNDREILEVMEIYVPRNLAHLAGHEIIIPPLQGVEKLQDSLDDHPFPNPCPVPREHWMKIQVTRTARLSAFSPDAKFNKSVVEVTVGHDLEQLLKACGDAMGRKKRRPQRLWVRWVEWEGDVERLWERTEVEEKSCLVLLHLVRARGVRDRFEAE